MHASSPRSQLKSFAQGSLIAALTCLLSTPAWAQVQPGDLLVSAWTFGTLKHYRPNGSLVNESAFPDFASMPGAALHPDGRWVTVGVTAQVIRYFNADGSIQTGHPAPELSLAADVAVFADGVVAAADVDGRKVELYSPTGDHLRTLQPQGMGRVHGLLVDSENTLWVTDLDALVLWRFDTAGNLLTSFPTIGSSGAGDVDEAPDGTLWASDREMGALDRYSKDGTHLTRIQTGFDMGIGIAVSSDGTLWSSHESGPDLVRHYAIDGTLLGSFPAQRAHLICISKGAGRPYCSPAQPHSGGTSARIRATGSSTVANNNLTLIAEDLPPGEFGYFLVGSNQGQFMPPGSQGVLCLSCGFVGCGGIGRFSQAGQIIQGPTGSLLIDLNALPLTPSVAVQPGDTWNFQCWFRDLGSSNFTDAVSVTFF